MAQYIDKSAIVAEIEKLKSEALQKKEQCKSKGLSKIAYQIGAYNKVLSFLNTLDVKKVDLEKEFDNYTKDIMACDVQCEPFTHLDNCAKYFFELGLKAQKGE